MVSNFSWVISGKLAGSALPDEAFHVPARESISGSRTSRLMTTDLADLHARGVRCLVSLTERAAGLSPYCLEAGLDWHFYPITDFGIPDGFESFDGLITRIIESMNHDRPVCVHCYAGIGRTGLVLCATVGRYLRLPAARAISSVRRIRSALETRDQEKFVHRYLSRY